ncbi:MATE family efflux transporter [Paenibacillus glycanilyticus]|uniref:MATE family efflux transporter n=1 Tax=Paenibacillus glycanilyticus TaxID=126569 RepID=UPI00203B5965|nr:MATE family efflux transporter [Paenibacillus glycanilyticus]MCM3630356.1 MATE family efflux transporter [Paenibacillus glycanilyticus]
MQKRERNKFSLWMLAWPIFIELFLQFLLGAADTLQVSRISDDAVAVVGFSTQLFSALMTLFMTVASGAGILIAQRIGSQRQEDARTIAIMSVKISAIIGLVISVPLYLFPGQIASAFQLPDELMSLAKTYISIVGGGMVLVAVMAALSNAIRNTGNTKGPMYTAIGMNIIHVGMNYAFIFGKFGFPEWGLRGVAISTDISRLLAVIVLLMMFLGAFERQITLRDFKLYDNKLFKEILKIGWPLGINMSCWVFSQLLIYTYIARLGAIELSARTYMNTLESFCFMLGYSLALALQIQIAHLYGAGKVQDAYKNSYRALWIGLAIVTVNALVLYLIGGKILKIFTDNPEIIAMGVSLLGMNLLLQPGKMLNMGLGNALNAVGDTRFVMWTSVTSMTLIATVLSYIFGITLGWGLVGIYACMILDEYIRGLWVLRRWRQKKFMEKGRGTAAPSTHSGGSKSASLEA